MHSEVQRLPRGKTLARGVAYLIFGSVVGLIVLTRELTKWRPSAPHVPSNDRDSQASTLTLLAVIFAVLIFARPSVGQTAPPPKYPALPSETPSKFAPVTDSFDYIKRDVMIPMRDKVKLHTVILIPKGVKGAPILLTRTPYNATDLTSRAQSTHLGLTLNGYDNATEVIVEGGYIRVVQDVRGKHGSEGDYVMTRPLHGPQNPTPVDHSTDTYDTIDWLVKNVPESNGRVGYPRNLL